MVLYCFSGERWYVLTGNEFLKRNILFVLWQAENSVSHFLELNISLMKILYKGKIFLRIQLVISEKLHSQINAICVLLQIFVKRLDRHHYTMMVDSFPPIFQYVLETDIMGKKAPRGKDHVALFSYVRCQRTVRRSPKASQWRSFSFRHGCHRRIGR